MSLHPYSAFGGREGDVQPLTQSDRRSYSIKIVIGCVAILSAYVLLSIIYQYRWYFPPDFDESPFLAGRRYSFVGWYRVAFYVHIAVGPIALIVGSFLLFTGGKHRWVRVHRSAGKFLLLLILLMVVPSGLVMSLQAYAGPVSEVGFIAQSLLTGFTIAIAAFFARSGNIARHRRWATRCYLLLWSPLLLRMIAGLMVVTGLESEWTYRLNAWLSWLVPLFIYECASRVDVTRHPSTLLSFAIKERRHARHSPSD